MSAGDALIRIHAHFSGMVQGVGFRYTTCRIARSFAVSGFVRNLADGRVEVIVEGSEREASSFIRKVHESMEQFIRSLRTERRPATGEFDAFTIA